jgi:hypothetical protein
MTVRVLSPTSMPGASYPLRTMRSLYEQPLVVPQLEQT